MGIFKNLFSFFNRKKDTIQQNQNNQNAKAKSEKPEQVNYITEAQFEKLPDAEKNAYLTNIMNMLSESDIESAVKKTPFVLKNIIGGLKVSEDCGKKLVDIATKAGESVYDLIDKGAIVSNEDIVNIAVINQPELILELDDMPRLQDMITRGTFIYAFAKNPTVILSNAKVLKQKFTIDYVDKNGKDAKRNVNLRSQLLRAINLYYRPNATASSGYDKFAYRITTLMEANENFATAIKGKKITTRLATPVNEMIKQNPSSGRYLPGESLKLNNNKVLYLTPKQIRLKNARTKEYNDVVQEVVDFLKNPALNAFDQNTKNKLVRRCVEVWPETYFELKNIKGLEDTANCLTVQMSAYKTLKNRKQTELLNKLAGQIGEEQTKKVVARNKANQTRKQNKGNPTAKKAQNKAEKWNALGDALMQGAMSSKEVTKDLDR